MKSLVFLIFISFLNIALASNQNCYDQYQKQREMCAEREKSNQNDCLYLYCGTDIPCGQENECSEMVESLGESCVERVNKSLSDCLNQ